MARSTPTRRLLLVLAVALFALPAAPAGADTPADLERQGVREIIVQRVAGLDAAERADVRADAGVRLDDTLRLPRTEVVRVQSGSLTEALSALNADPDVVYAEPNGPVHASTADASWNLLWGLDNLGQWVNGVAGTADADIDAPEAWGLGTTGADVTVAVVDSGVFAAHTDLADRIAVNAGESGAGRETNNADDDGNGLVDDVRGWDWVGGDNAPDDANGHGTHVAGTIAARQDTQGIVGVAPGARIMPLRVLNSGGSGDWADIADAFDLAGDMGVPVVNASLGGTYRSTAVLDAIIAHPNTLYVVAAGNESEDNDVSPHYPCALPPANVVCVGATDSRDLPASFSNSGATTVDLYAPGVSAYSTNMAGGTPWVYKSGTSMATPHVAGALALMRAAAPALNATQLKAAVMDAVDPLAALSGKAVSGGRLNAAHGVQRALVTAGLPVPDPDTDGDGVKDVTDNCPSIANAGQADNDGDGKGNPCDGTPYGPDGDRDGVANVFDNCPAVYNPSQRDRDGDGTGDACDATPLGHDADGDGRGALIDNCPAVYNPDQADRDRDGVGDACDTPGTVGARPTEPRTPTSPRTPPILRIRLPHGTPTVIVCRGRAGCRARPLKLSFRLDRSATVTARVERRTCANRSCRYATTNTLARSARAGQNRLVIGIGATARLKVGSYRVRLSARSGGRRSATTAGAFRVR